MLMLAIRAVMAIITLTKTRAWHSSLETLTVILQTLSLSAVAALEVALFRRACLPSYRGQPVHSCAVTLDHTLTVYLTSAID